MLTFFSVHLNLDLSSQSPLPFEIHHAGGVVVLCCPDLHVHLPLAVLPAQLASFRQKRAKSVSAGASKKTSKRKGPTVPKNDVSTQNCHVEPAPPSANDAELESKTNHNQVHHLTNRFFVAYRSVRLI